MFARGARAAAVLPTTAGQTALPIVDLGYELHQAISLDVRYAMLPYPFLPHGVMLSYCDEQTQTYNFSNIRYAAPPTGPLRFRPPVPVAAGPGNSSKEVENGAQGRVCPQAALRWEEEIMPGFVAGVLASESGAAGPASGDARTTEDCLFLDVIVPKEVFERNTIQRKGNKAHDGLAPVLVWIDGGGYIAGDKTEQSPLGLIQRSLVDGEDGIVYVAINYRLGAFGWLSDGNGIANAGLYDQRLALEWVKEHIGLFGGDPDRITVMGQSAGAGSIVHQLATYGDDTNPQARPFRQAIVQSPIWYPLSAKQQASTRDAFLELLNVSSIEEAQSLPSEQLIATNAYQIANTPIYGTFTYGPVVDGSLVRDWPSKILLDPNFGWQDLRLMTGHASNEGLIFTPPAGVNSSAYATILSDFLPDLAPESLEDIAQTLYPTSSNASAANLGYSDALGRMALTISDAFFTCKNQYLSIALDTYAYIFDVPPGLHSYDLYFTFYDPARPDPSVVDVDLALAIQDYIISFVREGRPSSLAAAAATSWIPYRAQNQVLNIQAGNISSVPDPVGRDRCQVWWKLTG
ncbi:alpha/beta-hydrolase [Aspergillus saccharolyticus JOP 1030-1]|uniref:Carboxylic ester hydrolase n=1 Tax=Aspergillus saccharolyticus JOP 1030-1 TaxID=1450539 RepID=A0A318ZHK8_9EURO|nr:alpha/beta-hydrolase [Aspergillus saccharolyticus JOP 1030-1]PYH46979.1 alpha/beta-hydrolase [Aspergillus saccharolyticus JOP 1030-1]